MVFFFFLSGKFIELNMVGFPLPCLINYKRARVLSVLIVSQMCVHINYVYNIYIYNCKYVQLHSFMCMYFYMCIQLCIYIYIYTYMLTFVCTRYTFHPSTLPCTCDSNQQSRVVLKP